MKIRQTIKNIRRLGSHATLKKVSTLNETDQQILKALENGGSIVMREDDNEPVTITMLNYQEMLKWGRAKNKLDLTMLDKYGHEISQATLTRKKE